MDTPSKRWQNNKPPKKILAIRMHAIGDVIITLPYLQYLRNSFPAGTRLDFVTITESHAIPENIDLFSKVYVIKGWRSFKKQLFHAFLLLPKLFLQRYDVIIDLQNNAISRFLRKCLMPKAWSTFDKISRIPAGERTQITIENAGLGKNLACNNFILKNELGVEKLLQEHGWNTENDLIILNPAGAFETRSWPLPNYVSFAKLWLTKFPRTQFLILGVDTILQKATYLDQQLDKHVVNLVNKTSPAQAFAIVQKVKFVLSEDSGLMHMGWVSGIPTMALFGSSRSYWSKPLGIHSKLLSSEDLECGNCMLLTCKYGDNHCLTRYSPEMVFEKTVSLLNDLTCTENCSVE